MAISRVAYVSINNLGIDRYRRSSITYMSIREVVVLVGYISIVNIVKNLRSYRVI